MSFTYVTLIDPVTEKKYPIPLAQYQYSGAEVGGWNTSIYTKNNLEKYQQGLWNVCKKLRLRVGERTQLHFMYEKDISTSYMLFVRMPDSAGLQYVRIFPYISEDPYGTPENFGNTFMDVFDVTQSDYVWSIHNALREDGVRDMTLPETTSRASSIYYYGVGTSLSNYTSAAMCLFYDKAQNYIGSAEVGGIVSDYRRVIADPQYIVRRKVAGFHAFPFSTEYDPNENGGYSDTEIPDGDFDDESDPMDFADGPTISPIDTGFLSLYNPTVNEIRSLAQYMWSDAFSLNSFKKLFADPMDCILGLSIVPVQPPQGIRRTITVGNIPIEGVEMTTIPNQIVHVDCGTLNLNEYWGSALDYAPNSKITLFLPYIGFRQLDIDEVMKKPITIRYNVDVLTGGCVAEIMTRTTDGQSMIAYSFDGNCAVQVPVTGADFGNMLSMTVKSVGTMVGAAATGGASAGVQAAAVAGGLTNTVNGVMNSKPTIQHSGNMAGGSGQLGQQRPYFILERPRQSLPEGYQQIEGYPANITRQLGTLSGFTQVDNLHLENINATDSELAEIESLLKSGVIL